MHSNGDITCRKHGLEGHQKEPMAAYVKEGGHCMTTHKNDQLLKRADLLSNGFNPHNLMIFNT